MSSTDDDENISERPEEESELSPAIETSYVQEDATISDELISLFSEFTGCNDRAIASSYLNAVDGDIELAVNFFVTGVSLTELRQQNRDVSDAVDVMAEAFNRLGVQDFSVDTEDNRHRNNDLFTEEINEDVEERDDTEAMAATDDTPTEPSSHPVLHFPPVFSTPGGNGRRTLLMNMGSRNLEDILQALTSEGIDTMRMNMQGNLKDNQLEELLPELLDTNDQCINMLDVNHILASLDVADAPLEVAVNSIYALGNPIISFRNYIEAGEVGYDVAEVNINALLINSEFHVTIQRLMEKLSVDASEDLIVRMLQIIEAFVSVFLEGPVKAYHKCKLWFTPPRRSGRNLAERLKCSTKSSKHIIVSYILDRLEIFGEDSLEKIGATKLEHLWTNRLFDPSWAVVIKDRACEVLSHALCRGASLEVIEKLVNRVDGCRANVNPSTNYKKLSTNPLYLAAKAEAFDEKSTKEEWSGKAMDILLHAGAEPRLMFPNRSPKDLSTRYIQREARRHKFTETAQNLLLKFLRQDSIPTVSLDPKITDAYCLDDQKTLSYEVVPCLLETLINCTSVCLDSTKSNTHVSVVTRLLDLTYFILSSAPKSIGNVCEGKLRGSLLMVSQQIVNNVTNSVALEILAEILALIMSRISDSKEFASFLGRCGVTSKLTRFIPNESKFLFEWKSDETEVIQQICLNLEAGNEAAVIDLAQLLQTTCIQPTTILPTEASLLHISLLHSSNLVKSLSMYFEKKQYSDSTLAHFFNCFELPISVYDSEDLANNVISTYQRRNPLTVLLIVLQKRLSNQLKKILSSKSGIFSHLYVPNDKAKNCSTMSKIRNVLEPLTLNMNFGRDIESTLISCLPLTSLKQIWKQVFISSTQSLLAETKYAEFWKNVVGHKIYIYEGELGISGSFLVKAFHEATNSHVLESTNQEIPPIFVILAFCKFKIQNCAFKPKKQLLQYDIDVVGSSSVRLGSLTPGSEVCFWYEGGLDFSSSKFEVQGDNIPMPENPERYVCGWKTGKIVRHNRETKHFDIEYSSLLAEGDRIIDVGSRVTFTPTKMSNTMKLFWRSSKRKMKLSNLDSDDKLATHTVVATYGRLLMTEKSHMLDLSVDRVRKVRTPENGPIIVEKNMQYSRLVPLNMSYDVNLHPVFTVKLRPTRVSKEIVKSKALEVGDFVLARYMGRQRYYRGQISRVNRDKSLDIAYDDADSERGVAQNLVRRVYSHPDILSDGERSVQTDFRVVFKDIIADLDEARRSGDLHSSLLGRKEHTFVSRGFCSEPAFLASFKKTLNETGYGVFAQFQDYYQATSLQKTLLALDPTANHFEVLVSYEPLKCAPNMVREEISRNKMAATSNENRNKYLESLRTGLDLIRPHVFKQGDRILVSLDEIPTTDSDWFSATYVGAHSSEQSSMPSNHSCVLDSGIVLHGLDVHQLMTGDNMQLAAKLSAKSAEYASSLALNMVSKLYPSDLTIELQKFGIRHARTDQMRVNLPVATEGCTATNQHTAKTTDLIPRLKCFGKFNPYKMICLDETSEKTVFAGAVEYDVQNICLPDICLNIVVGDKKRRVSASSNKSVFQLIHEMHLSSESGCLKKLHNSYDFSCEWSMDSYDKPSIPNAVEWNVAPECAYLLELISKLHRFATNSEEPCGFHIEVVENIWKNAYLNDFIAGQQRNPLYVACRVYNGISPYFVSTYPFLLKKATRSNFWRMYCLGRSRSVHYLQNELSGYGLKKQSLAQATLEFQSFFGQRNSGSPGGAFLIDQNYVAYEELQTKCDRLEDDIRKLEEEELIGVLNEDLAKVSRKTKGCLLSDAMRLMSAHKSRKSKLVVQFCGENASGDGVTSEFYAAVARELQKQETNTKHPLFAGLEDSSMLFIEPLIPNPGGSATCANQNRNVLERYHFLGRLMGKAVLDEETVPIPLHPLFFDLVRHALLHPLNDFKRFEEKILGIFENRSSTNIVNLIRSHISARNLGLAKASNNNLPFEDLVFIDHSSQLSTLTHVSLPADKEESKSSTEAAKLELKFPAQANQDLLNSYAKAASEAGMTQKEIENIIIDKGFTKTHVFHALHASQSIRNKRLERVSLNQAKSKIDAELSRVELIPRGSQIQVSPENVDEYLKHLVAYMCSWGIVNQVHNFKDGLLDVLGYDAVSQLFSSFDSKEIRSLLCGEESIEWKDEPLLGCISPRGKYTSESRSIKQLIEVLTTMNMAERSKFLSFATACGRVPISGLPEIKIYPPIVEKINAVLLRGSTSGFTPSPESRFYTRFCTAILDSYEIVKPGYIRVNIRKIIEGSFIVGQMVNFESGHHKLYVAEIFETPTAVQCDPYLRPKATTCANTVYLPERYKNKDHMLQIFREAFEDARLGGIHD